MEVKVDAPRWALQFSKYIDTFQEDYNYAGIAWGLAHIHDFTDEQHEEIRTLLTKEYGQ
jgi:hypothetical protein